MTPEAQRIAIAESVGFRMITECDDGPHDGRLFGFPAGKTLEQELPDYPCDLNAMHEVEKILTDDQAFPGYYDALAATGKPIPDYDQRHIMCATAAQRAEAYLKTINRWDDSK